jgi:hypothetical protein
MIPLVELRDSLWGAWRLAHLDASGMRWFNLTADGFYRSFVAALLVAPAYLLLVWLDAAFAGSQRSVLADIVAYPLLWLIYPVLLAASVRPLGLASGYAAGVVALNWAQVVIMAALLPVSLLVLTDALGAFGLLLYLATYAASLFYTWSVLRTALGTTPAIAAALTAAGELIGMLVQRAMSSLG